MKESNTPVDSATFKYLQRDISADTQKVFIIESRAFNRRENIKYKTAKAE